MRRLLALCAVVGALTTVGPSAAGAAGVNQDPNQDYVAMGDSYSSGNGTGDYYESTCYRSTFAYGPLIDPQIPGTFSHPACSGGRTNHIDQDAQNGFPKQVDLLGPATKFISLTIGGNDAGFTDALQNCAIPFGGCADNGGSLDDAQDFIQNNLPALLDRNYAAIRAKAPNAVVTVIGYPRIFKASGTCNLVFSDAEVKKANVTADLLSDVMRQRVQAAGPGFAYVDSRTAWIGHGACDSTEWINGFSVSDTVGSFHPNKAGYEHFAGMTASTLLAERRVNQAVGPNGRIAFVSGRDGNSEIYVMNGNGDFPLDVSNDAGADIDPAWSSDGTKLAFASNRDGDNEIYVLDFDNGGLTKLTSNTADDREPVWSPNGDRIAFRTNRDGNNEIYSMTSAGGSPANLTNNAASDTAPAWSPDGSEIAFQRLISGSNNDVFRMNSDGQGQTNLAANAADDGAPDWSPDGNSIAFHSNRDGDFEIFTMTRAGASVTQRTTNSTSDTQPGYSPSGASVAFTAARDGNDEIYTMPAAGGTQTRRTSSAGTDTSATWQGDATPPRTTIDSGPAGTVTSAQPTFEFHANEPGSTLACKLDGAPYSACSSPLTTETLTDGPHTFQIRATDPSGNVEATPASRTFTVAIPVDDTTIDSGPSGITSNPAPQFNFSSTQAGTTFECRIDGGASAPCTSPFTAPPLSDGQHEFSVRGTPPGGSPGAPITATFTVDATAPETAIDAGPPAIGSEPRPTFEFSAGEAGSTFECRLDSTDPGDWVSCDSPRGQADALGDGPHQFEVRAADAAGNVDPTPATLAFTVDTTAPTTSIDAAPGDDTTTPTPTFEFSSEAGAAFECRFDSGDDADWAPCSSPLTSQHLADGPHTFEVRAIDAAGNVEPAPQSADFTIDATPPQTTINTGPAEGSFTNGATPTFGFSSDDLAPTFECRVDGAEGGLWVPCDQTFQTSHLADGSHTFEVQARDASGNVDPSPASRGFTVDTVAPETALDSGPPPKSNDDTPTFAFSSGAGTSFQCRLDGGDWESCISPKTYSHSPVGNGPHTFQARAIDAAGNVGPPVSQDFAVRVVTLDTAIDSGPGGPTNQASPSFGFSSTPAGEAFQCRLDTSAGEGSWGSCASGKTYSTLGDGDYTFRVMAVDEYGNSDPTPAVRAFRRDTVAPGLDIDEASLPPRINTADVTATFTNDDATAPSQCRLDGGLWTACASPQQLPGLSEGSHQFEVRATDAAGNQGTDSRTFVVDLTPPQTAFTAGPLGPTSSSNPAFGFAATESGATFECSLDSGTWATCASPWSTGQLADGQHEVAVRATDAAGNVDSSPASRAFTVDTRPPDTQISAGPEGATRDTAPVFAFRSDDPGSAFECRVDDGPFGACRSEDRLATLGDGPHRFEVRATDEAGNADASPAGRDFTVDTRVTDASVVVAPKLKVRGKPKLPIFVSAGEAADASATGLAKAGRKKVGLPAKSLSLQSRAKTTLKLTPSAKGAKRIRAVLAGGKRVKVLLTVTFTDELGNQAVETRTVKLVGKRRR